MSLLETCSKKGRFVVGGGRCPLVTAVAAARTGGILAVTKPPAIRAATKQTNSQFDVTGCYCRYNFTMSSTTAKREFYNGKKSVLQCCYYSVTFVTVNPPNFAGEKVTLHCGIQLQRHDLERQTVAAAVPPFCQ